MAAATFPRTPRRVTYNNLLWRYDRGSGTSRYIRARDARIIVICYNDTVLQQRSSFAQRKQRTTSATAPQYYNLI